LWIIFAVAVAIAVEEERRRIEGDSTPIGDERFKKAEERLLANAGIFKHKYGESGRYADDEDNDDEVFEKKKKEGSKILATFKSEMADIVHMESDDVDEDYYGDDAPGERKKKMSKSWRMQQKSKTSSSTAKAKMIHKQSHHEEKVTTTSSSSITSPDDLEATKRSGAAARATRERVSRRSKKRDDELKVTLLRLATRDLKKQRRGYSQTQGFLNINTASRVATPTTKTTTTSL
jgi:hypothetical protein